PGSERNAMATRFQPLITSTAEACWRSLYPSISRSRWKRCGRRHQLDAAAQPYRGALPWRVAGCVAEPRAICMPIPSDQLERATRALTVYCNDLPESVRDRVRLGFRLDGNAIVLFESHPYFQNRSRWI